MMTSEEEETLLSRYRASVSEAPALALDEIIMAASARHAANRRIIRRGRGAALVISIAVFGSAISWHLQRTGSGRPLPAVTNFGLIEGVTRPYLLQAGTASATPATLEGAP